MIALVVVVLISAAALRFRTLYLWFRVRLGRTHSAAGRVRADRTLFVVQRVRSGRTHSGIAGLAERELFR
jgi:hypothetical protein